MVAETKEIACFRMAMLESWPLSLIETLWRDVG